MVEYNPFIKTALKRKDLSVPMRYLHEHELLTGKILDFGCGNGDDLHRLIELGYDLAGYDKHNPKYNDISLLEKSYDTVVCNYVLNVIPSLATHMEVIKVLKRLGKNVYIAVRSDKKAIKNNWKWSEQEQGYWTGRGSFQRFYDKSMIKEMFGEVEYLVANSSLILFRY